MASTTTSNGLATIEPYQPIPGLPTSEQFSRAHEHYLAPLSKLARKHAALLDQHEGYKSEVRTKDTVQEVTMANWKRRAFGAGTQLGVAMVAGSMLGLVDGRFGGEKGHVSKWGVPLDGAIGIAGVLGTAVGLAVTSKNNPNSLVPAALGALAMSGAGAFLHRHGKEVGLAWASRTGASDAASTGASAPNGAGKGVTYTVHAATK